LTAGLPSAPASKDFKAIWGDIKEVYIDVQHSKCVFCEQRLEGKITQDVEHFRPKAEVNPWTVPARLAKMGVTVKQRAGGKSERGYRFLAFHVLNYAMACKNCNTVFKGNLFPVAADRQVDATHPPAAATERNYLVYPISDIDIDPETIIEFEGVMPIAQGSGFHRLRALVCIELFGLDDTEGRKELIKDRGEAIEMLYWNLREVADGGPRIGPATQNINRLLRDSQPHANCLRSFKRLFDHDRPKADKVVEDIWQLLDSMSR